MAGWAPTRARAHALRRTRVICTGTSIRQRRGRYRWCRAQVDFEPETFIIYIPALTAASIPNRMQIWPSQLIVPMRCP